MKINSWINLYKPKGISSAKAVAIIKQAVKPAKVGHAGTLDLEAEGILPIATGEATKLTSLLMMAKKTYEFTIQFGAQTDSADAAGKILKLTDNIPSSQACQEICCSFIGKIKQVPPIYSALKVNGQRAYAIARSGGQVELNSREVTIYELDYLRYDSLNKRVSYRCVCSKGTYIRTLAEDISLSLQSLGFVLELRRLRVGMFSVDTAINVASLQNYSLQQIQKLLQEKSLRIEEVLDDIPALEADNQQEQTIRYGQKCYFDSQIHQDLDPVWVRNHGKLIAIGNLQQGIFKSSRVFNL